MVFSSNIKRCIVKKEVELNDVTRINSLERKHSFRCISEVYLLGLPRQFFWVSLTFYLTQSKVLL